MPWVLAGETVAYPPQLGTGHDNDHLMLDAAKGTALHMDRHGLAILMGFSCRGDSSQCPPDQSWAIVSAMH